MCFLVWTSVCCSLLVWAVAHSFKISLERKEKEKKKTATEHQGEKKNPLWKREKNLLLAQIEKNWERKKGSKGCGLIIVVVVEGDVEDVA